MGEDRRGGSTGVAHTHEKLDEFPALRHQLRSQITLTTPRSNHAAAATPHPVALNPFIVSSAFLKSHLPLSSGMNSPLAIHSTRIPRSYVRLGSNFGVMRKYWLPPSPSLLPPLSSSSTSSSSVGVCEVGRSVVFPHAMPTIRLWTSRSLRGSMPWLISSTTRKGDLVRDWRDMR